VIEVTKRMLSTILLGLALAGTAAARPTSPPLSGVVVGTGNGLVFVAGHGGKLTAVRGHASLGTHVTFRHGHLVLLGRAHAKAATPTVVGAHVQIANGVLRHDDDPAAGAAKFEIEGIVAAVGTGTVTLDVGGQMLVLQLPTGVSIPASFVGRTVEFELKFVATGIAAGDDDPNEHGVVTTPMPMPMPTPMPTTPGHDDGDSSGHGGGGHGGDDHGGGGR
jgi:hypothetical protein